MVYYEIEDDCIIKYEVSIDKESLEQLKKIIQSNCAEMLQPATSRGMEQPESDPKTRIRFEFMNREPIYEGENFKEYEWSYTEYKDPKLVFIINQLLEGEVEGIWDLKHPEEPATEKEKCERRINQYIPVNVNTDLYRLKTAINDYETYLSYNKGRLTNGKYSTSAITYYPKVLECITLNEICRMPLDEAKEILQFFGSQFEYLHLEEYEKEQARLKDKSNRAEMADTDGKQPKRI